MSTDQDAEVGAAPPEGVLQELQLRPMTIPVACTYTRFECGMCRAKWVETKRIAAVGM